MHTLLLSEINVNAIDLRTEDTIVQLVPPYERQASACRLYCHAQLLKLYTQHQRRIAHRRQHWQWLKLPSGSDVAQWSNRGLEEDPTVNEQEANRKP